MMRRWIVALAVAVACPAGVRADDEIRGNLVIIGGALRYTDVSVWKTIIDLAGGSGSTIAVFPTASSQPVLSGERVVKIFEKLGAKAFVVPVGVLNIAQDYRQIVTDPEWAAKVKAAGGVYFTGGSQARITQALLTKDGNTPLLDAVWDVYRRGGVVAGTSAGAAIMSHTMFSHPQTVMQTLEKGVSMGTEIDRGLGFLSHEWFVDQHCLVRGRFARALVAMQARGIKYGLGIDEDTAVVVKKGRELTVCGYKGCLVLDLSEAKRDAELPGFNMQNVKMSYLDRGDSINLATKEIIPHEYKRENPKIDPQSADFKPTLKKPIFATDILGNNVISALMSQLLSHATGEATGIAYDGAAAAARADDSRGFEFRLYRGKDTCGWFTDEEGYEAYTVQNIRMDVEPVVLSAPLYSYFKVKPAQPTTTQTAATAPAGPAATPMVVNATAKVESEPGAQK